MEGNSDKPQPPKQTPTPPPRLVNLPATYVNSFQVNLSASDIVITFMLNGQPFQMLNVSYSTAKGLAEALNGAVKKYENETSSKILSAREASSLLKRQ